MPHETLVRQVTFVEYPWCARSSTKLLHFISAKVHYFLSFKAHYKPKK